MTDKKQISSDNEVNDLIEKVNEQRAKPKPHAKSIKELKERLRDEGEICGMNTQTLTKRLENSKLNQ